MRSLGSRPRGSPGSRAGEQEVNRILQYGNIARREFDGAFDYLEDQEPGLGIRFEAEVKAHIRQILQQPNRFPKATRMTRVASLLVFQFNIYYRERGDVIYIVAVYHHSRKPDGWKYRK